MRTKTLETWVNINSGSDNPEGLRLMADALEESMQGIPGKLERIALPHGTHLDGSPFIPGDALSLRFNPEAPLKVLFSGHMDTVFGPEHPFQRFAHLDDGRIGGPGVADMKGGLFIMIESVKRFLSEDSTSALGGEILITADEEVGSPASHSLLVESAKANTLGLVFESALPGGELVRCRKGTGTFRVTAMGKPAHTGRDFESGRNAIVALAAFSTQCHALNNRISDAIVNVANFKAAGPVNVVPDRAEVWLNIRISDPVSVDIVKSALTSLIKETETAFEGIELQLTGDFLRTPKKETPENAALHRLWNKGEEDLGMPISGKRDTGGSSDGNIFGIAGLPHLDGVGIKGGAIHSPDEYAIPESIPAGIEKTVKFLHLLKEHPHCLNQTS